MYMQRRCGRRVRKGEDEVCKGSHERYKLMRINNPETSMLQLGVTIII